MAEKPLTKELFDCNSDRIINLTLRKMFDDQMVSMQAVTITREVLLKLLDAQKFTLFVYNSSVSPIELFAMECSKPLEKTIAEIETYFTSEDREAIKSHKERVQETVKSILSSGSFVGGRRVDASD